MNQGNEHIQTSINWDEIRSHFPVLQQHVNGKPLSYLDNGASSELPQVVIDRINAYHTNEHANVHRGIHSLSQHATDAYEQARKKVRALINARYEEEIIYTTGTTDSINLVANSYGRKHFKEGDVLKAASWKAPALNQPRGNVLQGNYPIQWTGPLYLK